MLQSWWLQLMLSDVTFHMQLILSDITFHMQLMLSEITFHTQLMLCDVTFHILQPGPCGLAGDFQPKDCHGEVNGGYSRDRTLSHHCLVLPWQL